MNPKRGRCVLALQGVCAEDVPFLVMMEDASITKDVGKRAKLLRELERKIIYERTCKGVDIVELASFKYLGKTALFKFFYNDDRYEGLVIMG